jgi:hypothetical protein
MPRLGQLVERRPQRGLVVGDRSRADALDDAVSDLASTTTTRS